MSYPRTLDTRRLDTYSSLWGSSGDLSYIWIGSWSLQAAHSWHRARKFIKPSNFKLWKYDSFNQTFI